MRALTAEIKRWGGSFGRPIDTVYVGGGTPSLLGERIIPLLGTVRDSFSVLPGAEITAEMNPTGDPLPFLRAAVQAGVNRLSVGVQSGLDRELSQLGRTHTAADAVRTVKAARDCGFSNISLDLMLGLPEQDGDALRESLRFLTGLHPEHLSAYLLKIEPNTRFFMQRDTLSLPDDDAQAQLYLLTCEFLAQKGYRHYEISNFALPGAESRHNLKYWTGAEYLGIGPAAHSFVGGRRFFYPRDLNAFLTAPAAEAEGTGAGGGAEEMLMLRLRLADGLDFDEYFRRFGGTFTASLSGELSRLCKAGLGVLNGSRFSLTDRGMLVSNSIITELLECV